MCAALRAVAAARAEYAPKLATSEPPICRPAGPSGASASFPIDVPKTPVGV